MFVITMCRQHTQLQLCFHCERDITCFMSCSLPILGWKKHKLMAGLCSRAAVQALRRACWEREYTGGGGQVRMSWALKWETSRDYYPLLWSLHSHQTSSLVVQLNQFHFSSEGVCRFVCLHAWMCKNRHKG